MPQPVVLPDGCSYLIGTLADSAGVIRAKQVDARRATVFTTAGLGSSRSWAVFCADDVAAPLPAVTPVGDLRIRADAARVRPLGGRLAQAPLDVVTQTGDPAPTCYREAVRRQAAAAAALGLEVLTGAEIEFVAFLPDGVTPASGPAYGVRALLDHEAFVDAVFTSFTRAGLGVEQFHAEYGPGQFELSLPPADPLTTADHVVLARVLISRAARAHGLRVSFSPWPLLGDGAIGTGAHVHLSARRHGVPLLQGGPGPAGLTPGGEALVAGLVHHLPEAMGAFAPSFVSTLRLRPENWAGSFACWGVENREAALRLCRATPGNPHGASLEVKCIDPTANPHVVQAALLGVLVEALARPRPLPAQVALDPARLDDDERARRGVVPVGRELGETLARFEDSDLMRAVFGPDLLDALVAVRRHELDVAKNHAVEQVVEAYRFAWTP